MAAGRVALLCLGLCLVVAEVTSQSRSCQVPTWPTERDLGPDPIAASRGRVLVVALVKGYCGYCVAQSENLQALQAHLVRQGFPNVDVLLINGGEAISRDNIQNLYDATDLPVIQDTEDNVLYRDVFNASKDDFIIYDRCGQRAFYIPHPYSYLGHSITERVIRATHRGRQGCYCRLDSQARRNRPSTAVNRRRNNRRRGGSSISSSSSSSIISSSSSSSSSSSRSDPHDQMMGDQPQIGAARVAGSVRRNAINCPVGDAWCRRYLHAFSRRPRGRQGYPDDPESSMFQGGQGYRPTGRGHGRRRGGHRRGEHRGQGRRPAHHRSRGGHRRHHPGRRPSIDNLDDFTYHRNAGVLPRYNNAL